MVEVGKVNDGVLEAPKFSEQNPDEIDEAHTDLNAEGCECTTASQQGDSGDSEGNDPDRASDRLLLPG